MFIAILFGLFASMAYAASTIVDSRLSNKAFKHTSTIVFYSAICSTPLLPVLFLFGTPSLPPAELWPFLFFVAVVDVVYLFPYMSALRHIDTSVINAMFSLGRIIVPVLAFFFLGERLEATQYAGFAIMIAASFSLSLSRGRKGAGFKINKALWLMLAVSLILSLASVVNKGSVDRIGWIDFIFWTVILFHINTLFLLLVGKFRREIMSSAGAVRKNWRPLLLANVLNFIGVMCGVFSLEHLPITVRSAIGSSQAFFALLFGYILCRFFSKDHTECITRDAIVKKIILFTIIFIGIALTAAP